MSESKTDGKVLLRTEQCLWLLFNKHFGYEIKDHGTGRTQGKMKIP
jgi:hypothetical protein